MSQSRRFVLGLLAMLAVIVCGSPASATEFLGTLHYTNFAGGSNVNKVSFDYDGVSTFSLGSPVNITTTPGADGIIFAADGDLLIGGQFTNAVYKVNVASGTFTSASTGGQSAFHLTLDPSGTKFWAGELPGKLSEIPLPLATGTSHTLTGDDTSVTGLAFLAGKVFYTSSGPGGIGNFGTIDLSTFTTTRLLTDLPAAHGIIADSFTGDLILTGDSHVSQIDPAAPTVIKSDRLFPDADFDQGAADAFGHLFAAQNSGFITFIDFSSTGLVGDLTNFTDTEFLSENLDDFAPLSGPGSIPVPEPGSITLLLIGGLGLVGHRWYRRARA